MVHHAHLAQEKPLHRGRVVMLRRHPRSQKQFQKTGAFGSGEPGDFPRSFINDKDENDNDV